MHKRSVRTDRWPHSIHTNVRRRSHHAPALSTHMSTVAERLPVRLRVVATVLATVLATGLALTSCAPDPSDAATPTTGATTAAASAVEIGASLQADASLSAQQYSTGLTNVAALAFDSTGRLWASTAAFTADGSDGVYLIDQQGATPTLVIDEVTTPLGLLWVGDELYVASASRVDAYGDFDGTLFATKRTVVEFAEGVGEVNGLAMSPSGRIMLGISAPCNACTTTDQHSASIVSFLQDGSDLRVYASDIRAAIGLAYYPGTDDLFVTMNQRDDLGDATPGDLLAVVEAGQSWGFPDCYGQDAEGCPTQPEAIAELDQHAAVSGVAIVTGQLGDAVGTSAVVAEWSTGLLLSVALDPADPTRQSSPSILVTGMTNPVGLVMGTDGALYSGDWATGIIYRISSASV
jgi:glucose/arabinose dehydrogenase